MRVLTEHMQLWNMMRDHLVLKSDEHHRGGRDNTSNQQRQQPRRSNLAPVKQEQRGNDNPSGGAARGKGQGRREGKPAPADKTLFVSASRGQTPFCRAWNDQGSCPEASCKFVHECNAQLLSGAGCGNKNHGRVKHDGARHGSTKTR